MSLTGTPFLALTAVLVAALTLTCLLVWNRLPGPAALRVGLRLTLLLATQAAAVAVVLVCVNDSYSLYDSWGDLTGTPATGSGPGTGVELSSGPGGRTGYGLLPTDPGHPAFRPTVQGLLAADEVGPGSQVHGNLLVWLPPGYDQPEHQGERYPVVELLPGQPGSPMAWFNAMKGQDELEKLVTARQARPMILVAAKSNTLGTRDAGCADLPGGPKTATWLGEDVPAIVKNQFRASADPYDWSVMGYSAGGYCAVNLVLHHPELFHTAVSISGYNDPIAPAVRRYPALVRSNDPLVLLRRAAQQPDVDLLLTGSRQDGQTVGDARTLIRTLRPPAAGDLLTVPRGGHNLEVWRSMLPDSFRWISRHTR
ncbi:enterochelin esterase-like enzyme [Streptacidiphilus sp. MAP12-16]|uniref:alpha/beta hydrolase n=1 Tax=Streptacidiphilus sp. MAP12-16 TaxID=3156300 RepID=UPI003511243D